VSGVSIIGAPVPKLLPEKLLLDWYPGTHQTFTDIS
jgi:hypothetical protein